MQDKKNYYTASMPLDFASIVKCYYYTQRGLKDTEDNAKQAEIKTLFKNITGKDAPNEINDDTYKNSSEKK